MAVVILSALTLRKLFHLRRKVVVSCRHCGYRREYAGWYLAKLMQDVGEDISVHRLSERSKCSQCGVRKMRFDIERRDGEGPDEPPIVA